MFFFLLFFFIITIVLLNFFSSPCNFTRSSINASSNGYPLYQRFIHRLYGRHVVFITESACRLYNFWPLHIVHVFVSDIVFNLPPYFKNQSIQDYYIVISNTQKNKEAVLRQSRVGPTRFFVATFDYISSSSFKCSFEPLFCFQSFSVGTTLSSWILPYTRES